METGKYMGIVLLGILTSLTAAAIVGLIALARRGLRARSPLWASFEHIVREGWAVVLPTGLQLPAAPTAADQIGYRPVYDLLHRAGAVDHIDSEYSAVLTNTSGRFVRIIDLRIRLLERIDPLQGTVVTCPTAGAGAALLLLFQLDDPEPVAWQWEDSGPRLQTGTRPYFEHGDIRLQPDESIPLIIVARTEQHYCRWQLDAVVEIGRRRRTVALLAGERSFRVTGTPKNGFDEQLEWAWYDHPNATFKRPDWLD